MCQVKKKLNNISWWFFISIFLLIFYFHAATYLFFFPFHVLILIVFYDHALMLTSDLDMMNIYITFYMQVYNVTVWVLARVTPKSQLPYIVLIQYRQFVSLTLFSLYIHMQYWLEFLCHLLLSDLCYRTIHRLCI